jgi:drug/metabolite transporter (DMT)-like permease
MHSSAPADRRRGIQLMLMAMLLFAGMDAGLKWLSPHYPALQVAALRAWVSLPFIILYITWRKKWAGMLNIRWSLHLLRAALGIAMLALFTYGLRDMPLSEAYAIVFIAPAMITLLAIPILKEKVSASRWIAIGAGFLGVLVVLKPGGTQLISHAALAMLIAALCYSISAVMVRVVLRTDSNESLIFWLMLMVGIGATAISLHEWKAILFEHWWVLLGIGLLGFAAQVLLTEAFRLGEASMIAPYEYTNLIWALGIDWLIWQQWPGLSTLLGAAIIAISGIFLLRKESQPLESERP